MQAVTKGQGNPKHDTTARRKRNPLTVTKRLSALRNHGKGLTPSAIQNKLDRAARRKG